MRSETVVRRFKILLLLLGSLNPASNAATLLVPDSFPSIQSAIDSATSGDEIVVATGTYYENLEFRGDDIVLRSTNPEDWNIVANTVIDGSRQNTVVTFAGGESPECVLEGFTITHGYSAVDAVRAGGIRGNRTRATIRRNRVEKNSVISGFFNSGTGAIWECDGLIERNIIAENESSGPISSAGIVSCHGIIRNNLIAYNRANGSSATAAGLSGCNGEIVNNTIVYNQAEGYGDTGSGILGCRGRIENCILWGNVARNAPQIYRSSPPVSCCIQDWDGGGGGEGNINLDPHFADASGGDFHLQGDSPCIDLAAVLGPDEDLDGNSRPLDVPGHGHELSGDEIDIGAYEFAGIGSPNNSPKRPVNLSPAEGEAGTPTFPILFSSVFSDSDQDDFQLAAQWQISDSSAFSNLLYDTGRSASELMEAKVPFNVLSTTSVYYWRVRHVDSNYGYSRWSIPTSFSTRSPRTISIPGESSSIQAAIDQAEHGDEIVVSSATYEENLKFIGKNIILRSMNPEDPQVVGSTVIEGMFQGPVVQFSGVESPNCLLDGFTLTGGGFARGAGVSGSGTHATIRRNRIVGNSGYFILKAGETVAVQQRGGGLYDCDGRITQNIVAHNQSGYGGGLFGCDGLIDNNLIYSNEVFFSGGGFSSCDGIIQNNTVYGNQIRYEGPALFDCWGTLANNVFWGNFNQYTPNTDVEQIELTSLPEYCCIQNWVGEGEGNIDQDPIFLNPEDEDFHLQSTSPCVDAGKCVNPLSPDFEGDVRSSDGTEDSRGNGSEVDMGADEFAGVVIPIPIPEVLERTSPDILYVSQCGYGGSGLSWETSFPTITQALENAVWGDQIWVKEGTYRESIRLKSGIALYGGFGRFEGEEEFSTRDPDRFRTRIDRTGVGETVVVADRIQDATFDGFQVTGGGITSFDPEPGERGGGLLATESSLSILNCNFVGNRAFRDGGGVHCRYPINVRLISCQILDNEARVGGGVHLEQSGSVFIQDCLISRNRAGDGGGMSSFGISLEVFDTVIADNSATFSGGGIRIGGAGSPHFGFCEIKNNRSGANSYGAGVSSTGSEPKFESCILSNNEGARFGGGIAFGQLGTSYSGDRTQAPFVTNCLIFGNEAEEGTAICWAGDERVSIVNSTIAQNGAESSGSAIYTVDYSEVELSLLNSILVNSSVELKGSGWRASYSCIAGGVTGEGIIDSDPLFVNKEGGDFHLQSGSPCIDSASQIGPDYDLDKILRPLDIPDIGRELTFDEYDMGAYEFSQGARPSPTPTPFSCVHAATLTLECTGGLGLGGPVNDMRLKFHAGTQDATQCALASCPDESLLVNCVINCRDWAGSTDTVAITNALLGDIGTCIDDQSGGVMSWSIVTGPGRTPSIFVQSEVPFHCCFCGSEVGAPCMGNQGYPLGVCALYNICDGTPGNETDDPAGFVSGLGFACLDSPCPGAPTPTPTTAASLTPSTTSTPPPTSTPNPTNTPEPPTATPTETPFECDSGYYVLDSLGGRHRVGNPPLITGPVYFGTDIARDLERAVCDVAGATHEDLVVLDGYGMAHFVEGQACNIPQDFFFGDPVTRNDYPQGRAVDLQMTADSAGFWVLTDYGEVYRAGSALVGSTSPELGVGQRGLLGFDIPTMRDAGTRSLIPTGTSLRAVSFAAVDENGNSQADGFIVLDSMGGRFHYLPDGSEVPPGTSAGLTGNEPLRLLDPTGYVWPFFPGLDIARDMELHPSQGGVVILDGWGGIHPVPVNNPSNPVWFARNETPGGGPAQTVGMPYLVLGFDDPTTGPGIDEDDPFEYGLDAASIFIDLEFSAGCPDSGLYTLDKFGGVFALGSTRANENEPVPGFGGSPYFYPFLYAEDLEVFAEDETEFDIITVEIPHLPEGARPMRLVRIPAGTFEMGSPDDERGRNQDEGPIHTVNIAYDFYLTETEITQAQWEGVMGIPAPATNWGSGNNHPVYNVSWLNCQLFVDELRQLTGKEYRLPSEAEWEYAARSGTSTRFYFGDSLGCDDESSDCEAGTFPGNRTNYMWYLGNDNPLGSKSVAQKFANAFGLYDMYGNVWEWVQDWSHRSYIGAPFDGSAWETRQGSVNRVLRGGGWGASAHICRSAFRGGTFPGTRSFDFGFRVAITL